MDSFVPWFIITCLGIWASRQEHAMLRLEVERLRERIETIHDVYHQDMMTVIREAFPGST